MEEAYLKILGTIASLSLAATALLTHFFQRRQKAEAWYQTFRELYARFWTDEQIAEVRSWIACDAAYEKVRPTLGQRFKGEVAVEEYWILERVDRFCALIIQIVQLNPEKGNSEQKKYYSELYDRYWFDKVRTRRELWKYVEKFWRTLHSSVEELAAERKRGDEKLRTRWRWRTTEDLKRRLDPEPDC